MAGLSLQGVGPPAAGCRSGPLRDSRPERDLPPGIGPRRVVPFGPARDDRLRDPSRNQELAGEAEENPPVVYGTAPPCSRRPRDEAAPPTVAERQCRGRHPPRSADLLQARRSGRAPFPWSATVDRK